MWNLLRLVFVQTIPTRLIIFPPQLPQSFRFPMNSLQKSHVATLAAKPSRCRDKICSSRVVETMRQWQSNWSVFTNSILPSKRVSLGIIGIARIFIQSSSRFRLSYHISRIHTALCEWQLERKRKRQGWCSTCEVRRRDKGLFRWLHGNLVDENATSRKTERLRLRFTNAMGVLGWRHWKQGNLLLFWD